MLFKDDALHNEANAMFVDFSSFNIVTLIVNITELIISDSNVDFIKILKEMNIKHANITMDENLFIRDKISPTLRKQLKAINCMVLAYCILNKMGLISFDKRLIKAYTSLMN